MDLRSLHQTARTLGYWSRAQDVTANNLANANTAGFKLDRITAAEARDGSYPVPVQETDLAQGRLRETSRELDLALEGDGYLVVQAPNGERLTRGGALRLDADSQLVSMEGFPILGEDGQPIVLPAGTLTVTPEGLVQIDGEQIATLQLRRPAEGTRLLKEGNGRFVADGAVEAADAVRVRQGQVEEPNGDTLSGMVDLITIQRAYTANADAMKAMDRVLGTITSDIGRL